MSRKRLGQVHTITLLNLSKLTNHTKLDGENDRLQSRVIYLLMVINSLFDCDCQKPNRPSKLEHLCYLLGTFWTSQDDIHTFIILLICRKKDTNDQGMDKFLNSKTSSEGVSTVSFTLLTNLNELSSSSSVTLAEWTTSTNSSFWVATHYWTL